MDFRYYIIKKSGLFNIDYYFYNNPDIKKAKINPILHFIQHGWREGRNPSPQFNTNFYLEMNPDVKESLINPFFHYLISGQFEGRNTLPSTNKIYSNNLIKSIISHTSQNIKLGLVVLIRNEQDVLDTFLNHIDALFDIVYLIDHRSVDSSTLFIQKAVKQRSNWTYVKLDVNGYYQKETMNFFLPILFEKGADFVFFLDCDEFIQIKCRDDLLSKLRYLSNNQLVGSFRWINCMSEDLGSFEFGFNSSIWKILKPSPFCKVVIPKTVYDLYGGKIFLTQGNHEALNANGNFIDTLEIGHLIHIPVRSRTQIINKAIRSSLSNIARSTWKQGESYQFFKMLEMIASGEINDNVFRSFVLLYQNELNISERSKTKLIVGDYERTCLKKLNIANSRKFSFKIEHKYDYMLERNIANQILSWGTDELGNFYYDQSQQRITINK